MITNNLMDVKTILQAFQPSRVFRRQMKNARCHVCGLGAVAADIALVEVELHSGRQETRIIHKQCTGLLWDVIDELDRLAAESDDADDWAEDPRMDDAPEAS